jgi:hypothetical protein
MSTGSSIKSRNLDTFVHFGPVEVKIGNNPYFIYGPGAVKYRFSGIQVTESVGNRRSPDGKYRSGGPFFTYRIDSRIPTRKISANWGPWRYSGPICMPGLPVNLNGHTPPEPDSSSLDPYGAKAISIVDPTNSNAQLGIDLGEFITERRLSFPVINAWKRRASIAKAAGSEYLAAQFGWLPLISDIRNGAQSVKDGNLILENYQNASGTDVHREFEFPIEHSVDTSIVAKGTSAVYNPNVSIGPEAELNDQDVTRIRETTTRRWFSGSFTYTSGEDSSLQKCLGINSEADKLFGISVSPDILWELTPWTWALDWVSNAGSVIHNATSLGLAGLVMRYGFIMEETSIVDTYTMPGTGLKGVFGTVPPIVMTYNVKRRRPANPFGFGLSWEGLSPTQLAITAALGITRL